MVVEILASYAGINYDLNLRFNGNIEDFNIGGINVESGSVIESTVVKKDEEWGFGVSAVVYIL